MNLDFGILWIEDSFSKEEEENLKRRVREAGFIARIETIPNSKSIGELARAHSLYHYYDIILLDYRLEDENGDVIAPKIRELFPSTTILFYSGSVEEDELRRMMAEKQVEGVYCSARRRFIERTGSLIEQTARSLDRLSGMRGLAMRVVAECDDIMKTTVMYMSSRDPEGQKRLDKLDSDVLEFIKGMKDTYEASLSEGIEGRLNTRAVDSAKLFDHFRRLTKVVTGFPNEFGLNAAQVERLRELRNNTTNYTKDVLQRRNILGHVIEVQGAEGWVLTGSKEINVSDFPDIRRLFSVNIDALREMNEILVPTGD
jgi:CheY-like chemotaxis protein